MKTKKKILWLLCSCAVAVVLVWELGKDLDLPVILLKANMSKIKIESGVQLLARLTKKPNLEKFYPYLFQSEPSVGDIIEIYNDNKCTSLLLSDIISEALIHKDINGISAGVLIFNTDNNISYDELINILKRKIWTTMCATDTAPDTLEFNKRVKEILVNLHTFHIYDATQFYATIYNLECTLVEHPNISLIIIDTLTAFYWSEQGFKITSMDLYTKNLINIIQKVTKGYQTISIYTRPEYFCTNKDSNIIPADYQIQLLDHDKERYQVNIKTSSTRLSRFFTITDGDLRWIQLI